MRRAKSLEEKGIYYVDVGTSGGVWGLSEGYSMMVGGDKQAIERIRPLLESLAPGADLGWGHVGASGSGHFVKMIHNGIEYGLMQAYAEGFEVLKKKDFGLDLHQIAEIWKHGSVVRSSNAAREIHFLISGRRKRDAFSKILTQENAHLPAQQVCPIDGTVDWWVDLEAANA